MVISILGFTVESLRDLSPLLTILGRFATAILVTILGFVFGRIAGKLTTKAIFDLKLNGLIEKHHLDTVAGSFVKYLIYIVSVVIALNQIGLALNVLNSIVVILLIVVAVGIFLSVKDFIPNMIAGVYITYKKKIRIGQQIKVKDVEGEVQSIELIETKIKTKLGHEIVIPNSFFIKNIVHIKPQRVKAKKVSKK